MDTVVGT